MACQYPRLPLSLPQSWFQVSHHPFIFLHLRSSSAFVKLWNVVRVFIVVSCIFLLFGKSLVPHDSCPESISVFCIFAVSSRVFSPCLLLPLPTTSRGIYRISPPHFALSCGFEFSGLTVQPSPECPARRRLGRHRPRNCESRLTSRVSV